MADWGKKGWYLVEGQKGVVHRGKVSWGQKCYAYCLRLFLTLFLQPTSIRAMCLKSGIDSKGWRLSLDLLLFLCGSPCSSVLRTQ